MLLAALALAAPSPSPEGSASATTVATMTVVDSLPVAAAGFGTAGPRGATVVLSKVPDGYQVRGSCTVRASRGIAWGVLTDYDGIDTFVPSIKVSRVLERRADHTMVEQIAAARLFVFGRRMRVVLRVHEQRPDSILFEDTARKDFLHYRGAWSLESHGADTRLVYRVIAKPNFSVPDFVLRSALRNSIRSLLTNVGVEVERRAALVAH